MISLCIHYNRSILAVAAVEEEGVNHSLHNILAGMVRGEGLRLDRVE